MSGLLVGIRSGPGPTWTRMLGELEVLGGNGNASWFDPDQEVALGRTYRHEHGTLVEAAIVHHGFCTVVLDGRLSSQRSGNDTTTDSQAIVESYLRWGEDCSAHLHGEFAFALWDGRLRRL